MTIQDMKKGSRFLFNHETYIVARKWIDDERPLIAINETTREKHKFYHEGLEIEIADNTPIK